MNLVELYDIVIQAQSLNGVPLSNGHVYIYALGRTRLMDTWSDVAGESLNTNPVILDNAGQAKIYVSDAFDYTLVFTDEYDNEIFSVDKYLLSQGAHSHADVAVAPSESIAVSSYNVGEVTVYVPYLTGQLGKVYTGIDPIVVNNTEDKISANHVPLGVQDPLYFVQDDEEGCIIGCSAQTEIPSAISGKWDAASDAVITNSAQWAENTEYEAGNYISIDDNVINVTGLSPVPTDTASTGLVAQVSADIVSQIPSTAGLATEQWVEGKGYLTGVDIPESANWNSTYNTVHDNSASWTGGGGGTANPQIPVTGINGIKISESGDKVVFEVSGDYYPGNNPSGFITGVDLSDYATTAELADKQDITGMTAYQPVGNYQTAGDYLTTADSANFYTTANESGFITGVDLTPYQEKADMTAYATVESLTAKQDAGNYLSATDSANFLLTSDSGNFYTTANESGFITGVDLTPYQLTADMTAYQPVGDYLTTADSANFYPMTGNPSGFINELPDEEEVEFEEVDLAAYQPVSSMTAYQSAGDYYSASNPSGFITGVPVGTMNESAFGYDANDKISGYNGSAFAGGSEQVQSDWTMTAVDSPAYILNKPTEKNLIAGANVTITESNDDVTIETTEIASGLQLVAGPGVTLTVSGSNIVAATDETVLFETNSPSGVSAVTCSETVKNFERIAVLPSRFVTNLGGGTGPYQYYETKWLTTGADTVNTIEPMIFEYLFWKIAKYSANNDFTQFVWNGGFEVQQDTHTYTNLSTCNVGIKKIIGINRIAGV